MLKAHANPRLSILNVQSSVFLGSMKTIDMLVQDAKTQSKKFPSGSDGTFRNGVEPI